MNPLTELLAGRDRWTGAACVGDWTTFDPRGDRETDTDYIERVRHAQAVCVACPILADCRDFTANVRPRDRAGTWAGTPYDNRGRPVRIPQEDK